LDITFILVNPAVPENIGASARAIKTMGFKKLRLVNPPNDFIEKARILAHGSSDILHQTEIYDSFDKSIEGLDFLIATSSKKRRTNEEYVSANELEDLLNGKHKQVNHIGIVFGGEESGLSNSFIKKCDVVSFIPLINPYPSLNLSHAIMIYAYLLSGFTIPVIKKIENTQEASLKILKKKVNIILNEIELKQAHIITPRIFEKISLLKDDDISLMHAICNAYLERKKH
jgi:tRNA/rRNA methyltransferase